MALPIYRLRRWLAVIAALFLTALAGIYFYARVRQRAALKELPNKLGFDIRQTASGFQFSKSDGKRTLFTIQAEQLKQFKLDGSAELHKVSIVLYGRDSSRFDQIYGENFTYDKKSGHIRAGGRVQIDLEANPGGLTGPDQSLPKELKNPIHLETRDLDFNQESGDASTPARVDFRTPQSSGSAVGMKYSAKDNTLTLVSEIHVTLGGERAGTLSATHGTITRDPRVIMLVGAHLQRESGSLQAGQASFFLGQDGHLERISAREGVSVENSPTSGGMRARADEAEVLFIDQRDQVNQNDRVRTATLAGKVHAERSGIQSVQGEAGRVILDFSAANQLQKVHAVEGVKLSQHHIRGTVMPVGGNLTGRPPPGSSSAAPDFDLDAPVVDFLVVRGRYLDQVHTSGPAQIMISALGNSDGARAPASVPKTVVTAGGFVGKFVTDPKGESRLTSVHGGPDAKIVNSTPGSPERVSSSQTVDASFLPQGGIESIVQQGGVVYSDGQPVDKRTQAWANRAVYTPSDQVLALGGTPRISSGGMVTTARTIRINRESGEAVAEGDVKSTYSELKEQPNGALLSSTSPIHATGNLMTYKTPPAVASYQGDARLWQDGNIIQAPLIEFDRERRSLLATGTAEHPVSTVLVQAISSRSRGKTGAGASPPDPKAEPTKKGGGRATMATTVAISAIKLTYADSERRARYDGGVVVKETGLTATANSISVRLIPRHQTPNNQSLAGPSRIESMVAEGKVQLQQATRRATGEQLIYTATEEKFVLTGGPPSIFDAERGKITGVSLTFFRTDDRVLVEGEASTPVVTKTRVAR